jgi:hypothetical protein
MRINSSGNVGIGTASPSSKVEIAGNLLITGANIFTDATSGIFFSGANNNFTNGIGGVGINNIFFQTASAERMRIDSSGNVMIGTTSSAYKFYVDDANNRTEANAQVRIGGSGYSLYNFLDGTAAYIGQNSNSRSLRIYSGGSSGTGVNLAAGGTSWGTFSDERLKYEIENINDAITKIKNIRCVSYKLKDVDTEISSKRLGVIAQSLVGKLDEVLDYSKKSEEDENEYISVRYSEIIPVLIKSIQEQQAIIEELKATTTSQQTKIDSLEAKLTALES